MMDVGNARTVKNYSSSLNPLEGTHMLFSVLIMVLYE
jgi:hypothetical protein